MTEACLAIVLVFGEGATALAESFKDHFNSGRVTTDASDVQNGDLLVIEKLTELEWIADNVILLPGNRAPIVRKLTLAEALAQINTEREE